MRHYYFLLLCGERGTQEKREEREECSPERTFRILNSFLRRAYDTQHRVVVVGRAGWQVFKMDLCVSGTTDCPSPSMNPTQHSKMEQQYWNDLDRYVEMKRQCWKKMNAEERQKEFESDGSDKWVSRFYAKMCEKYGVKFVKCPVRKDYGL